MVKSINCGVFVLVIISLLGTPLFGETLLDGLTAQLNGTCSGTTCFDATGKFNVTISNAAIAQSFGRVGGSSFKFIAANSEYGNFSSVSKSVQLNLSALSEFAFSLWVNKTGAGSDTSLIGSNYGACGASNFLMGDSTTTNHQVYFEPSGTNVVYTGSLPLGSYNHYVWVINKTNNSQQLYINGAFVMAGSATSNTMLGFSGSSCFLMFGRGTTSGTRTLDGFIDDLAFWNRTLSASEASAIYNNESNGISYPWGISAAPPQPTLTVNSRYPNISLTRIDPRIVNLTVDINIADLNFTNPNNVTSCSIYVDNQLQQTKNTSTINQSNYRFSFRLPTMQGVRDVYYFCSNQWGYNVTSLNNTVTFSPMNLVDDFSSNNVNSQLFNKSIAYSDALKFTGFINQTDGNLLLDNKGFSTANQGGEDSGINFFTLTNINNTEIEFKNVITAITCTATGAPACATSINTYVTNLSGNNLGGLNKTLIKGTSVGGSSNTFTDTLLSNNNISFIKRFNTLYTYINNNLNTTTDLSLYGNSPLSILIIEAGSAQTDATQEGSWRSLFNTSAYYTSSPVSPLGTLSLIYPENNMLSRNGSNTNFTVSTNTTIDNTNLSLFLNDIKVDTRSISNNSNPLTSIFYRNLSSGSYNYYFQLQHTMETFNSSTRTFTIDQTPWFNGSASPANNSQFNDNNITITQQVYSLLPFNATLILNGVINTTTEYSSGAQLVRFNQLYTDGTFNWKINITTWERYNTSSQNTFFVDSILPTISTSFTNNSAFGLFTGQNITGQFNFTDEQVISSFNISIDGNQIAGQNGLSSSFVQYNLSYNPSGLSIGNHTLTVRFADGHTAQRINDYRVDTGNLFNKYLKYTFEDDESIKISPKTGSMFDSFATDKQFDRYSFSYTPNTQASTQKFIIESTKPLYIIDRPDTVYKKWLVTTDRWIDFLNEDETAQVAIESLDSYRAEITISNIKNKDMIKFNSIGDLNIVQQNFTFFIFNVTLTYNNPILEISQQTPKIDFIFNSFGINVTNINVTWNNTLKTVYGPTLNLPTGINYSTLYIPPLTGMVNLYNITWNFIVNNNPFSASFLQTTNPFGATNASGVGSCLNGNYTKAMTFISYDEIQTTRQLPNTTLNLNLNVYGPDNIHFTQLNISFSGASNYSICITPPDKEFNITAVMQYTAPGYQTRSYYILNSSINNITQIVPLYSLNTTLASLVTTNVFDLSTSNVVPGSYVMMLRYYPESNSYNVVEIEQSDPNGNAIFSIVPYNTFYKFIVIHNGQVYIPQNSGVGQTIATGTLSLPISLSENVLEPLFGLLNTGGSVSCNGATCSFIWADARGIVETAILQVYRVNGWGRTLIFNTTSDQSSGQLLYTITENMNGSSYLGIGSVIDAEGNVYVLGQDSLLGNPNSLSQLSDVKTVIFTAFMILLTISFLLIDFGPTGIMVGIIMGILAGNFFGVVPIVWSVQIALFSVLLIALWVSKQRGGR